MGMCMSCTTCSSLHELEGQGELKKFNLYSVECVNGRNIYKKLKEFSLKEYSVYAEDERKLDCFHNCTLLLSNIQSNIHAFNSSAMRAVQDYSFRKKSSDEIRTELDIVLSGRFFNFLNSVKAFIDQTESSLCRIYGGKDSSEFKEWKAVTGREFDRGLAYGFVDKLRNYCQHVGVPVFMHSAMHDSEKNTASYKFEFDRDELLSQYNEWRKVEGKLRDMPKYFSVIQLMSDWAVSFNEVSKYIHRFWYEYALEAACRIISYRREFQVVEGLVVECDVDEPVKEGWQRIPRFVPEAKARKVVIAYATPVH